jgi:myosin-15
MASSPPAAPPPPPSAENRPPLNQVLQNEDNHPLPFTVTKSPASPIPPAPPAPPVVAPKPTSKPGEPVVFMTSTGKAKTVRVGKIQWPPVKEEEHKAPVEVGRLSIDETQPRNSDIHGARSSVREKLDRMLNQRGSESNQKTPEKRPQVRINIAACRLDLSCLPGGHAGHRQS